MNANRMNRNGINVNGASANERDATGRRWVGRVACRDRPATGIAVGIDAGSRRWRYIVCRRPLRRAVDVHVAVDADRCREERWLACADVLHGERLRSWPQAVAWLTEQLARYPGCRLAATPVASGGWLLAENGDVPRELPRAPAGRRWPAWYGGLVVSCLHGWLADGHHLAELTAVTPLTGPPRPARSARARPGAR